MKKVKEYVINFINGFCMALADSVPGVSGGSIAFILGFYDKFIVALDDLFRKDWQKKKEAIIYIVKIGIGWIVGICLAVMFLASLFESHIYEMSSLFIGFIIIAIPIVIKAEKKALKGQYKNFIFTIVGALLVIIITYLNRTSGVLLNLDSFNAATIIYVFCAAMIAISAMVLPGISGSTMLLIFGVYLPIISKLKALVNMDFSVLPIIIVFSLGAICGILFFVRLLRKCLDSKRSGTMYFILGMMIASIYAIIMGPTTLNIKTDALSLETFSIPYFVLGGIIILSLEGTKFLLTANKKDNVTK